MIMVTMTRKQFVARAVKEAERRMGVPPGWWGTYDDVRGPCGVRVKLIDRRSGGWSVRVGKRLVSKHDSRAFAIKKARRLVSMLRA